MDTDSFILNIKTKDVYAGTANDAEKKFVRSNYEVERSVPKSKNKNVIGLMKDEISGKIMKQFVELGPTAFLFNR